MNARKQTEQNFNHFLESLRNLGADLDASAERTINQITNVGMAETVKNTPTGDYPPGGLVEFVIKRGKLAGKKVSFHASTAPSQGGYLKKMWMKTPVHKAGKTLTSGYSNNVEYAGYVNDGHRIKNSTDGPTKGWVPGAHMLEQGINAARRQSEPIFRQEIQRAKEKTGF